MNFKVCALIFYVHEGSSIANQLNMQKIMVSVFLTMKHTVEQDLNNRYVDIFELLKQIATVVLIPRLGPCISS